MQWFLLSRKQDWTQERSENFSRKRTNRNVLVEIQLVTVKTITITAFLGLFFL